ncbi:cilia- and flagella-associated protein 299 [Drosophila grimshawi]|uniref:Cilia- and flagella-associated protein 299 n=1 Tax=Drosophila grimshawi TaxID=7222 RepID=B4JAT9_DROGR|nr:cilia- and flagella-associated protein 299 [Drosophila grimshawi]EDW03897.1 GH11496 [Drosophila grimshawi]
MALLDYNSYEEYLDHFISINDVRYLGNWALSRQLIQNACGKSCMGRLLSRSEFVEQRKKAEVALDPHSISDFPLFGASYNGNDEVLQQFAQREHKLLNKQISTIIFLLMRSAKGLEISGFIDLEHSLRESRYKTSGHYVNWPAIFEGKARLMPRPHHLSYFDWKKNMVRCNNTPNFQVISGGVHSLLMMHRADHKIICVSAGCTCSYERNAQRSIYDSNIYGQCLFFDHNIRRIS